MTRECLLIADDLTGACDAAVHFAIRGYRTAASVSVDHLSLADVLAVSTDSRGLDAVATARVMSHTAPALSGERTRVLFKKIDSTLRGNAGVEVVAAREAFGCEAVVMTPAFPAMGRVVEAGCLRLAGDASFVPIEIGGWLRSQGVADFVHLPAHQVAGAIGSGCRLASTDAVCDDDLDRIVAGVLAQERRVLWAGSAGLAAAIARALPGGGERRTDAVRDSGPVLFCIGSDHAVTVVQQEMLAGCLPIARVSVDNSSADRVAKSLAKGEHVLLRIPRHASVDRLRASIVPARVSALLLSGGDTASLVCRAIGARHIELIDEIVPGLPRGILRGGDLDGVAVATKSGAFGKPDALVRVADFFRNSSSLDPRFQPHFPESR
jgi:uncharacterized protein YgbK (DUF1537 family)